MLSDEIYINKLELEKNKKHIIFNNYQKMNDAKNYYILIIKAYEMMYRQENSINN